MTSHERDRIRSIIIAYRRRALIASVFAIAAIALLVGVLLGSIFALIVTSLSQVTASSHLK